MRKHITALALLVMAGCAHASVPTPTPTYPADTQVIREAGTHVHVSDDDPMFNCLIMGNRTCGDTYTPWYADSTCVMSKHIVAYGAHVVCRDGRIFTYPI
jgi:hypothetical protein